jgi:hypothetical protein
MGETDTEKNKVNVGLFPTNLILAVLNLSVDFRSNQQSVKINI